MIIQNISKILKEQFFFGGEYETQEDNFFIYFKGRTVLKKEQLEKKIGRSKATILFNFFAEN